jgi:hypothetical protein
MENYDVTEDLVTQDNVTQSEAKMDNVTYNLFQKSEVTKNNVTNQNNKQINIGASTNTFIERAYWINNPIQQIKINFLPFKEDNFAYLKVKFNKLAIGKKVSIKIFDLDKSFDDQLLSYTNLITNEVLIFNIEISGKTFCKGYDSILKLYANLEIDGKKADYCKEKSSLLNVHVVRYIPQIMEANKLNVGASLQKIWFSTTANNNYLNKVGIGAVNFSYFLKYSRFVDFLNGCQKTENWFTDNSKKLLIKRINNNILLGKYKLPTSSKEVLKFGTTSKKNAKDNNGNNIPEFENNYMQTMTYKESKLSPIDDLFASLGTYKIKIIPFGIIIKIEESRFQILVNKLAFYIDDDFAYNGDEILGFWSPYSNRINKYEPENYTFYKISDGSYREYRALTNYGCDIRVMSDFHFINVL